MIGRTVEKSIDAYLRSNNHKILFIWGPRRSGKTTILKKLATKLKLPIFNFDLQSDREKFLPKREILEKIASEHKVVLIDEVQNYPEATISLKILFDEFKVKIIATGSSELRQKTANFDSLAGRFIEHYCLPLSVDEIIVHSKVPAHDMATFTADLAVQLQIFGSYPEVYSLKKVSGEGKIDLLQNIVDTYVLKDVINIYDLKNEKLAKDILTKIALQIGSEVSIREIAASLQANVVTVANYIEIFIKNYILIPLPSFKTNFRKAVSENRKLYFYDLGVRNLLVRDFRDLELRPDRGGVFENFIVSEVEKRRRNLNAKRSMYFYREYGGREVDLILEDYRKQYLAAEIKVTKQRVKDIFPLPHQRATISSDNYAEKLIEILP